MGSRFSIAKAVKRCYAEYPVGKMAACWWSLVTPYRGCLETGGEGNYKAHCWVNKSARCGVKNLPVPVSLAAAARAELLRLRAKQAAELSIGADTARTHPAQHPGHFRCFPCLWGRFLKI